MFFITIIQSAAMDTFGYDLRFPKRLAVEDCIAVQNLVCPRSLSPAYGK